MTTSPVSDATLTVAQAADRLGVSERTVWRYLKSGRLDGVTVGEIGSQRTLIAADDVAAFARARSGAAAVAPDAAARLAEADAQLARMRAECERLQARVDVLQRALVRWPGVGRFNGLVQAALGVLGRARQFRPAA